MAKKPVGYSGKTLVAKLGLKAGSRAVFLKMPDDVRADIEPLPEDIKVATSIRGVIDYVHVFATGKNELEGRLKQIREKLAPDGMAWVSWPKKASGLATDLTENIIRDVALPLGFVDVKVCAVTEVWSGLKLVIRRELRGK